VGWFADNANGLGRNAAYDVVVSGSTVYLENNKGPSISQPPPFSRGVPTRVRASGAQFDDRRASR
jgi:hypothetical protein